MIDCQNQSPPYNTQQPLHGCDNYLRASSWFCGEISFIISFTFRNPPERERERYTLTQWTAALSRLTFLPRAELECVWCNRACLSGMSSLIRILSNGQRPWDKKGHVKLRSVIGSVNCNFLPAAPLVNIGEREREGAASPQERRIKITKKLWCKKLNSKEHFIRGKRGDKRQRAREVPL